MGRAKTGVVNRNSGKMLFNAHMPVYTSWDLNSAARSRHEFDDGERHKTGERQEEGEEQTRQERDRGETEERHAPGAQGHQMGCSDRSVVPAPCVCGCVRIGAGAVWMDAWT